ncbi:MAG: tRNA pseudouridine(55) synthase TruB [Parachlamydiaceae bacterium]|nr:tRNA pseudouridine(55) synthase TruB [Parachlamydiaceae bacterium]
MSHDTLPSCEGILLVDKPKGKTAFDLVAILRRKLNVRTIGHAGTLDPMATGVMVMLIGKKFTTQSNQFLSEDKEYIGQVCLGIETDTYDAEGIQIETSDKIPTLEEINHALLSFQGQISQIPPMFSAKKINGQKLYHLARQGKTVERAPVTLQVQTDLISYHYPHIEIKITCSKGTYVRTIAHDLGKLLGCGAHLSALIRTRSGSGLLANCISGEQLYNGELTSLSIVERLCSSLKS